MTEIPFVESLGDAFDVAIAARSRQGSQLQRRHRAVRVAFALATTGAVAALVATPAIGLRAHIVRLFFDAPPAPERVVKSLTALDEGVPEHLRTRALATEARKVLERSVGFDRRVVVWLAPRTSGGFCTLLELERMDGSHEGAGGECVPLMQRLSFETSLKGRVSRRGEILSGPVLLDGWVALPKTDSLEVRFEDRTAVAIPFVWVSAPVNSGFFVYSVPQAHWRAGHVPETLVVRDGEGKEIARGTIRGIDLRAAYAQSER